MTPSNHKKAPLRDKQQKVLRFIIYFRSQYEYSPTSREIAETFGCRQTAAVGFLRALKRKGWITTVPGRARTIVVI